VPNYSYWQLSVYWDEPLDQKMKDKWKYIAYHDVERQSDDCATHYLHIFADESMKAHGAAVYIIMSMLIVIAKARVAPIKPPTLPPSPLLVSNVSNKS